MSASEAPIIGISGSLRKGSVNSALLRAAAGVAPAAVRVEIASIRDIPLYDGDLEAKDGIPKAVEELKDRIAAAVGLLLVTPEYNNSVPGVLKNAIDWLSRPPGDISRVFGGTPVAIMGATPGRGGTSLAQAAWLPILRTLGMEPWFGGRLEIPRAGDVFDESGNLIDDKTRERLEGFMSGFADFVHGQG